MLKNMKVGGLTSTFQVCIVHFLVFWGPGKFGLKKGTGGAPPQGDIVTFFYRFSYCRASLISRKKLHWSTLSLPSFYPSLTETFKHPAFRRQEFFLQISAQQRNESFKYFHCFSREIV